MAPSRNRARRSRREEDRFGRQDAVAVACSAAAGRGRSQQAPPDAAAVQGMSPADREKFITRMVDGLAERLKTDGKDLDGWIRLLRAYKVLGRDGDAVAALTSARQQLRRRSEIPGPRLDEVREGPRHRLHNTEFGKATGRHDTQATQRSW